MRQSWTVIIFCASFGCEFDSHSTSATNAWGSCETQCICESSRSWDVGWFPFPWPLLHFDAALTLDFFHSLLFFRLSCSSWDHLKRYSADKRIITDVSACTECPFPFRIPLTLHLLPACFSTFLSVEFDQCLFITKTSSMVSRTRCRAAVSLPHEWH